LETGCVGAGVPDSHYIFQGGISGFIEYKRTKAFSIKFQPEQVAWIDRYTRYGGRVWIAVRQMRVEGPRTTPQDNLFMITGDNIKTLSRQGLRGFITKRDMEILERPNQTIIWHNVDMTVMAKAWSGGPRFWNWEDIEKLLKS
jgi:hypothetical protein